MPLVSAIVPTFNCETRIKFALESIINQDYENLEIILINDASTDSTRNIAERILNQSDRRFSIIDHEHNRGVSAARNTGLNASNGEFIWFCDSDDFAGKNLVSILIALILKYNCDVAAGGTIDRFEDGRQDILQPINISSIKLLSGEKAAYMRMFEKGIHPHICCTIFRKDYIVENGLYFQEGCVRSEDIEFQIKAFCIAPKGVIFTPECLYVYFYHAEMGTVRDNNTTEKKLRRSFDNIYARFRIAEYVREHVKSPDFKALIDNSYLPEAVIRHFTILARADNKQEFNSRLKDEKIRSILKRTRKILFNKPEILFKALMLLYVPNLYFELRKKG